MPPFPRWKISEPISAFRVVDGFQPTSALF
jgi:hypothetical protein